MITPFQNGHHLIGLRMHAYVFAYTVENASFVTFLTYWRSWRHVWQWPLMTFKSVCLSGGHFEMNIVLVYSKIVVCQLPSVNMFVAYYEVDGVAQWKNVDLWPANFTWPATDLQRWVTIKFYMSKPSAVGQLTRLTQPFILSQSINE